MLKNINVLLPGSLLISTGCSNSDPAATTESCSANEQSVITSDQRTLCIELATATQAPFTTGFVAPARVIHQVTIKDFDGNPIDITSDPVISDISQHPMMYMNNGHDHTTPHGHEPDTLKSAEPFYSFPAYYSMAINTGDHAHSMFPAVFAT